MPRRCSPPGARAAPATRWSTPRCTRSTRPATCTTGCAWSVASFLVKDLGLDWRWGERYFAEKLNDFDLAANNGGWQWAASTGCDAQPYFRIFNPVAQSQRFDAEGKFIRRYLPVLARMPAELIHAPWLARPVDLAAAGVEIGRDYPAPIVHHDAARAKTLARYAAVKAPARSSA